MKRYRYLLAAAAIGWALAGCAPPQGKPEYTASGTVAGGAAGAVQALPAEKLQPLTIEDIEAMVRAKIGDDLIIAEIRNTRTVFHLSAAEIVNLKRAGVSEKVISFMIKTPAEIGSEPVAGTPTTPPPATPAEPVVGAPGPDYLWMGGDWVWFDGGWNWRHGYWRPSRNRTRIEPVGPGNVGSGRSPGHNDSGRNIFENSGSGRSVAEPEDSGHSIFENGGSGHGDAGHDGSDHGGVFENGGLGHGGGGGRR